jgi:hypothetical protein
MSYHVIFSTPDPLDPDHVQWCANTFNLIRHGGVWGIPRTGLIFTRTGENELTLTARMPYMDGMEELLTPEQLDEQQQSDYEGTRIHMEAAGITVKDATV